MRKYNMVKAFNLVVKYLDDATYNYDIIKAEYREKNNDFKFSIIEYTPSGSIENEYNLYVDVINENNEILNAFGDAVMDYNN